jgi:hypothetical protein
MNVVRFFDKARVKAQGAGSWWKSKLQPVNGEDTGVYSDEPKKRLWTRHYLASASVWKTVSAGWGLRGWVNLLFRVFITTFCLFYQLLCG